MQHFGSARAPADTEPGLQTQLQKTAISWLLRYNPFSQPLVVIREETWLKEEVQSRSPKENKSHPTPISTSSLI